MSNRIAIIGAGGHARVVLDALRTVSDLEGWGLLDDNPDLHGTSIDGLPVRGGLCLVRDFRDELDSAVIAIGNNVTRMWLAATLAGLGIPLARIVHRSAVVSPTARVGAGTVAMAGAVVQSGALIGDNVILNTAASIDHDGVVGDGVHLAPGVRLAGNVHIGNGAMLGIGTVVVPGISIGENCIVGAGSVVVRDLPPNTVCFGAPARVHRSIDTYEMSDCK